MGRIIAITDGVTISATTALTDITPGTIVINGDGMNDGRTATTVAFVAMTISDTLNGRRRDMAESTTCEGTVITAVGPDHGVILFSEAVIVDNSREYPNQRKPAFSTQAFPVYRGSSAYRQAEQTRTRHSPAVPQPLPNSTQSVINLASPGTNQLPDAVSDREGSVYAAQANH